MQEPDSVRRHFAYAALACLTAVTLVAAGVVAIVRAVRPEPPARQVVALTPSSTPTPPPAAATPSSTPAPAAVVPSPTATPTPSPPAVASRSTLTAQMAALAAAVGAGSVSVAARNLRTGATFSFGSAGGQTAASVVKVDILETLLLQQQASGDDLTDDQDTEATDMIEDSDDGAADDLWSDIGGGSAMATANHRLGVRCTEPGPGPEWGLTTTCAQGQIQLLYQLENRSSPLDSSSRAYILNLMDNVTESQSWGVPVVADADTEFAVKNGWLNMSGDTGWAVNSDGIVTYHGQTLLIAVLTQNNDTVYTGVDLVQQLSPLAAQSVAS